MHHAKRNTSGPWPSLLMLSLLALAAPGARGDAVDFESRTVTLALGAEPPQLDPARLEDVVSGTVLFYVKEGLLRWDDESGQVLPGVAERWEIDADGATFWLREDARWHDGKPVTAHDFVFAWRRVVDPAIASNAEGFEAIANATAIVEGRMPVTALGVRARSDRELEVSFDFPDPFFARKVASPVLLPVREDVVRAQGQAFAADHDRLAFNGPFVITEWAHDQRLRLGRNPEYWNEEAVWLSNIHWDYITADRRAQANLFRDGQIAFTTLDASTLPDALARGERIEPYRSGAISFVTFNFSPDNPTRSRHLRAALAKVVDPRLVVDRIIRSPGARPARSMFPSTVRDDGRLLHALIRPQPPEVDTEAAQAELARALEELGVETLPPLRVLLPTSSSVRIAIAEYLQNLWSETLGLEIRIVRQNFKQYLAQRNAGEFDIALGAWANVPGMPAMFAYPFHHTQRPSGYRGAEYDACLDQAWRSFAFEDRAEAYRCLHRIQNEETLAIPLAEGSSNYLVDPRLIGLRRRMAPDPDLRQARILPPGAEGP